MSDSVPTMKWRVGDFGAMISVSATTLRRWDRAGILVAHRYPSGTRYYTIEHVEKALGLSGSSNQPSSEYRSFLSREIHRLWTTGTPRGELLKRAQESWALTKARRDEPNDS